jgi:septum formation inhibitor MinC
MIVKKLPAIATRSCISIIQGLRLWRSTMRQAPSVAFVPPDEEISAGAQATKGERSREHVSLRGTTRGLEILITGAPSTTSLGERLTELLAEAPGFFAGCDARVVFENPLPPGALGCLEEVATRFELRIVEISPLVIRRRRTGVPRSLRPEDLPIVDLAEGTGPITDDLAPDMASPGAPSLNTASPVAGSPMTATQSGSSQNSSPMAASPMAESPMAESPMAESPMAESPMAESPMAASPTAAAAASITAGAATATAAGPAIAAGPAAAAGPATAAAAAASGTTAAAGHAATAAVAAAATVAVAELDDAEPRGPRLVVGPVRSGMIVDHAGHLVVVGDVNPGAEVRAEGSILVLGRMRGVAHAGIGRDRGFIVALSLQPQQLRIGRMVARAADADRPSDGAEIAYAAGETIVVERFLGRLPSGLAASM